MKEKKQTKKKDKLKNINPKRKFILNEIKKKQKHKIKLKKNREKKPENKTNRKYKVTKKN